MYPQCAISFIHGDKMFQVTDKKELNFQETDKQQITTDCVSRICESDLEKIN